MKKFTWLLLLLLGVSCSEGKKNTEQPDPTETKAVAEVSQEISKPETAIPVYDYQELEQAYLNGGADGVYVINFWATWCKPCVKELPAFEKVGETYKDRSVEVVLVSLDFPEHLDSRVVPFIAHHELQSEVVLLDDPDANYWISAVDKKWTGAIPATVIVKDGKRHFYERSFTYEELENELKTIL
ncbi:MAG: TlpA disulfide reductase family protein [Bacteroidota bacterium]